MSFIVGLTGGIGSGKSTVAECFSSLGVAVVDTDVIAHALTAAHGAAMQDIRTAFGESILLPDGSLDRAAMRRLVFSDPSAKARLEAIIHPLIRRESDARCHSVTGVPYVMLVVPLLIESGVYRNLVNRILVVDCPEDLQVSRVMSRSGLSDAEVRAIIATQASREQRLRAADDVVFNSAGREDLQEQVAALHLRYLELTVL